MEMEEKDLIDSEVANEQGLGFTSPKQRKRA